MQPAIRKPFGIFHVAVVLMLAFAVSACTTAQDLAPLPTTLSSYTSTKYAAIVVDGNNGKVLYQAACDDVRHPASLTKMMTLYLLFEAMESGRVSAATQIPVSDHARLQPPTKIGFRRGGTIDVDSAIKALVTKSANDVAVAIGEYLGGTEENFAALMTAKARAIGMRSTVFRNASGLPDPEQVTTARDMALLGLALRKRFPQYYYYFSTQSFAFNGRMIRGHNDLLGGVDGVDGIKTGYIRASGYNIVTSVSRGNRKLVAVVMGGDSARARNAEVAALIDRYMPENVATTGLTF
ncbi:D-alanyl-D-alanine carboxypeptidase family protein [Mesorhizobium sp. BAC0120]|nr:D-alanyl-D-alanine carboxypeptidase family protein [Mesorhizobium sp. BAC0120]MDW6024622.1 D-alanyl-D-alanine carboxypeptidase family protein [Mesorhizobium sp. BAC0120]